MFKNDIRHSVSMKIFSFITILAITGTFYPVDVIAATVSSEDFGTGSTSAISGWTDGGISGDDSEARAIGSGNDTASPNGGRFAVIFGTSGWICKSISTTGYTNVQLSYYWRGDSDSGSSSDDGIVEFKTSGDCDDSSGWTQLKNHDLREDGSWTTQNAFTNSGMNNTTVLLRFRTDTNHNDEHFRVDGISLTGDAADTTAPTLAQITAVPALDNDSTPSYMFSSTEAGTITYAGGCTSGTTNAVAGNNTITFASLADGTYASCTIKVKDAANNQSAALAVTSFDIDTAAPVISIVGANPMDLGTGDTFTDPGATANDAHDGSVAVVAAGSVNTSVPGTYTISYSATDAAGNTSPTSLRAVNISDDDAPIFSGMPGNMIVEALDLAGAIVSYIMPTASDNVDGDVSASVICTPASGSTFPFGNTLVGCSVSDAAGNDVTGSFNVLVQDTTDPILTVLPGDQTLEATNASGAVATFTVSANDNINGDVAGSIVCDALSGNTFPIGVTTVTCTAEDAASNEGVITFSITVEDTIAPTVTITQDENVETTNTSGAPANYTVTTTDAVDNNPAISCSPVSGSIFVPGATTVTCTATDFEGNVGTGTGTIVVVGRTNDGGSTDASPLEPVQAQTSGSTDESETESTSNTDEPTSDIGEAVVEEVAGEVAGASCTLFDAYIGMGADNADDIKFLQEFLNKEMGLTLEVNGEYDAATIEAVKAFQLKYASEILAPWGITQPTGIVYKTTQRMINMLSCPGTEIPMPELF